MLKVLSFVYFIIGCAVILFSVWPVGNCFSKIVVNKFDSPNSFNKFLTYVWLYPLGVCFLVYMLSII